MLASQQQRDILQAFSPQALNFLWQQDAYHAGIKLASQLLALAQSIEFPPTAWRRCGEFLENQSRE